MKNKGLMICLASLLLFVFGQARAEITVEEVVTRIGDNAVAYPQLSGMTDEAIQRKINDDIVLSSGAANHMMSLLTLSGQQKLNVEYDAWLDDRFFSVVLSARGKLPGKRDGHEYTALTYHLKTGERATLEDLFSDAAAAGKIMEEIALESLSGELSGYFEYSDITPLPEDSFTLDENGITFWYPAEQFSLVSGYSGACQFWYEELDGLWIGDPVPELTRQKQKTAIEQSVRSGMIPHVPVVMGQSMQEIAEEYRLLREPDEFPGGRYFVMEDPSLRNILIISDSISGDYADSVVEGVQLRRGALHGLMIGRETRDQWREVLGEPESTVVMTENMAYDYGLCEGSYDVYHYGEYRLRLYANADGVLFAIQLCT